MNRVWGPAAMPAALRRHALSMKLSMSTRRRHGAGPPTHNSALGNPTQSPANSLTDLVCRNSSGTGARIGLGDRGPPFLPCPTDRPPGPAALRSAERLHVAAGLSQAHSRRLLLDGLGGPAKLSGNLGGRTVGEQLFQSSDIVSCPRSFDLRSGHLTAPFPDPLTRGGRHDRPILLDAKVLLYRFLRRKKRRVLVPRHSRGQPILLRA
jgi:hypothetical protein